MLDVGAGVGTAGLCLARRVAVGRALMLLEREPAARAPRRARTSRATASATRVRVVDGDVGACGRRAARASGLATESFDHVIANPPFHDADAGTLAPDALKAGAHAMPDDGLEQLGALHGAHGGARRRRDA